MNTNDILMAAAILAVVLIVSARANAAGSTTGTAPRNRYGATLIREWAGWRYYSDGTVISPDGTYWHEGQLIYTQPTTF